MTTKQRLLHEIDAELSARRRIWRHAPHSTEQNPVFASADYNSRYGDLLAVKKVLEQIPEHIIQRALDSKPTDFWPSPSGQTQLF